MKTTAPSVIDPKNPNHWFIDKPRPTQILDLTETLALIANPGDFMETRDKWNVKSQALCDFMDELEKDGFVYNLQALRAFEKLHGLPAGSENGSVLSILVYNAQSFRRADQIVAEGWRPGAELLAAASPGDKIRVKGESILGGKVVEALTVRLINGVKYAMRPHKRKYAMNIAAMPCKMESTPRTQEINHESFMRLVAA